MIAKIGNLSWDNQVPQDFHKQRRKKTVNLVKDCNYICYNILKTQHTLK